MALEREGEPVAGHPDAAGPASLMSGFLGSMDPNEENNVKAEAKSVEQGRPKRQKVDHGLFFQNPNGFKKVIKTFPRIRFQGKGREFDDLNLLLKHYQKWAKELYPDEAIFEDFIYKARSVLCEKTKDKEGLMSDPRQQLHLFRHMYKSSSASLSNSLDSDKEGKSFHIPSGNLPEDVRQRIEQNRQRALQRKREREEPDMLLEPGPEAFEDIFDPVLGVDDEDEEDPFGHGGGLGLSDVHRGCPSAPAAPARACAVDDEDEDDPFGHGGGLGALDVQKGCPSAPAAAARASAAAEEDRAAAKLTSEQKQRIEENRQKALAKRQCATASESTGICRPSAVAINVLAAEPCVASGKVPNTSGVDGEDDEDVFGFGGGATEEDEEDVFGLGGGLD